MLPSGVGAGYTRKKTPRAEFVSKTQRTGVFKTPVLCIEEVFEMLCRKRIWVNRVRLKKTIQPAYLLWAETKATVIASVLEGGLVQRKTGNLRNVSLSAPRIPGGTPPSRLLPSVIFCHAASCALNRGATPSLHTARWTRRRIGYRHLSRDMVEVVTIFSWLPKFDRNRQISATRTADLPYTRIAEEGSNPVTGRLSLSHGLIRLDSLGVLPPPRGGVVQPRIFLLQTNKD